ncbi:MAG: DUF4469 domain-containing protein [Prevotellaceae bacterium]|nr:DUF4469 domain-containing protein [Prevotellaceae bacterium]
MFFFFETLEFFDNINFKFRANPQGNQVTLPLFNTSFSISGVFERPADSFDPNRHKLNINLTKGTLLRDAEKQVKLEKTNTSAPLPNIQEAKDSVSGTVNEKLTAGGVVELRGYNLKIEGEDPSCGLWFVAEGGAESKAKIFIENKPSRIIAMIPALDAGKYQVKIVSQYMTGGKQLKMPKQFIYPKHLAV